MHLGLVDSDYVNTFDKVINVQPKKQYKHDIYHGRYLDLLLV
jgi:hypothetical protein